MTVGRGWGFSESHLLPDVVVAFVDQELSLGAQERAAAHLAHCPRCAAEVAAQRTASTAVRRARTPAISAGFLASLRAIPQQTDLPTTPDNLAVGVDGQLVAVQRPDRVAGLRDGLPDGALGTSAPLGTSSAVLGGGTRFASARRRAGQGAGVVVSGLVLSALALVATSSVGGGAGENADAGGETPGRPPSGVWPAHFGAQGGAAPTTTSPTDSVTAPAPAAPAATAASSATAAPPAASSAAAAPPAATTTSSASPASSATPPSGGSIRTSSGVPPSGAAPSTAAAVPMLGPR